MKIVVEPIRWIVGLVLAMNIKEIGNCLRTKVLLKSLGSTVAIGGFFILYFAVLNSPAIPVYEMPVLRIDRWIPLLPFSVWIYFTLWIYICLPVALMQSGRLLGLYLAGAFAMAATSLAIFYFFPTAVPRWSIDWDQYGAIAFLKASDASGNACPSLHVGFAVFAAFWMQVMLKRLFFPPIWYWVSWTWCIVIIVSTLTTKQHVFLDVASGLVLGILVSVLNIRFLYDETVTANSSNGS